MSRLSNVVYYCSALKALLSKNGFYFLLSNLVTCKNSTIFQDTTLLALILRLSFSKCFPFFKVTTPSQKFAMNYSISIIFINFIIIMKINFIKIYSEIMSLISNKCDFIKIQPPVFSQVPVSYFGLQVVQKGPTY